MLIVTGLAGAGKTIALHTLEDLGYYCIDNLPVSMLQPLVSEFAATHSQPVAVAIDSRDPIGIASLPEHCQELRKNVQLQILFLTANTETLVKRFSETRRPHPAHIHRDNKQSLPDIIEQERQLLGNLFDLANITIDTSEYNIYRLQEKIQRLLGEKNQQKLIITLQSFGFKHGIPLNADFIFDVRFLPNPYWEKDIRHHTGQEQPVIDFFKQQNSVETFIDHTASYLKYCIPQFAQSTARTYLTICIGCTGGKHRSVYSAERIAQILKDNYPSTILIEHRDIEK